MPGSWVWVKTKDIVDYIQRGKSPQYSPIKKYPVLAQKCNQWSGITLENALFFEPKTFEKYTTERFLQTGDIVINSTGTGTLGRIGLFDANILQGYECIVADSHITVVRYNQSIVSKYVYFFLCSEYQQKIIEDNAAGSTNQKELYIDTIKEFYTPLPPIFEQRRIVSKIEETFSFIDQIEESKLSLSQFIKQTKSKVLDLTIRGKLVPQNPNDEPVKIENFKNKTSDISHYPKKWQVCKLSDVCIFERGITFPSSAKQTTNIQNSIACVRTANVQENLELDDLWYIDKSYIKNNTNKLLRQNDIIMSSANSKELVGKTSFVENIQQEMTFGGFVMVIRTEKIDSKYVFYFLRDCFLKGLFANSSTQTTNIANINSTTLGEMIFLIPPLAEQKRIVQKIETIFQILDCVQNNL